MTPIRKSVLVMTIALYATLATGCKSHLGTSNLEEPESENSERMMFSEASMENLDFLIGRWTGSAPDGSTFYEEYVATDTATLRSLRYDDATFASVTDSSTIALKNGQITSTWEEFVWQAKTISDGYAAFEPINAPSSFSWKQVDDDTVEVMQNWTDENSTAQSYTLQLSRVK